MDNETQKSKISKTEWGLVLGAAIMVDIAQIVADFLVIGVIVNRFVDVLMGLMLSFWLQMRGESLANPKRILGILGAFIGEMIPFVDGLPLWSLDVVYNWFISTKGKKLAAAAGLNNSTTATKNSMIGVGKVASPKR